MRSLCFFQPLSRPLLQPTQHTQTTAQLCPDSKVARYVRCAGAATQGACRAARGCEWSESTSYDNSTLAYVMGALYARACLRLMFLLVECFLMGGLFGDARWDFDSAQRPLLTTFP
jgi:hypothetical protein